MLISLTVGKVDAGVAVLLTEDKRLVSHRTWNPGLCLNSEPTDRIPFHPSSSLNIIWQYSRYQRRPQHRLRSRLPEVLLYPPKLHSYNFWSLFSVSARPPLPQRDSNFCSTRMGSNTTRNC